MEYIENTDTLIDATTLPTHHGTTGSLTSWILLLQKILIDKWNWKLWQNLTSIITQSSLQFKMQICQIKRHQFKKQTYVSATLDKLRYAKYFSSLDIRSAYSQVPLSKSSKHLTAFAVPNRDLFQFCRLPMGIANAPATFQRLIYRKFWALNLSHMYLPI